MKDCRAKLSRTRVSQCGLRGLNALIRSSRAEPDLTHTEAYVSIRHRMFWRLESSSWPAAKAPSPRPPRRARARSMQAAWIAAALDVLAADGIDAVRVEPIAKMLCGHQRQLLLAFRRSARADRRHACRNGRRDASLRSASRPPAMAILPFRCAGLPTSIPSAEMRAGLPSNSRSARSPIMTTTRHAPCRSSMPNGCSLLRPCSRSSAGHRTKRQPAP